MKTVKSIVFGSSLILGCLAAHAQFTGIGGAYNYAVLLGNNVNNSSVNGSVTGNVGAGSGTGVSVPSGGLIGGSLFLEGSSNPGANVNGTVTGSTTYNNAGIATIINDLNQLSSAYNSYSGVASLAINANSSGSVQTVAACSGTLENNSTFGSAYVYDVSSVDLANGGTLQISGSSNTRVVLNVDSLCQSLLHHHLFQKVPTPGWC